MILDYGCGFGGNYNFLSKRGVYFGLDILEDNINYAKNRYTRVNFKVFDGKTIPFPDGYFDEVHAYDVLEHVEDLDKVLSEVSRVLKKGGKFFITIPAAVSEKALINIKPNYFEEVGHKRIVDPKYLINWSKRGFEILTNNKCRGMEAVVLSIVFWFNKNRRSVKYQTGSPEFSKMLVAFIWLFDSRLFRTNLKYFFFIYIFTLPVGYLISRIFPKTIYLVLKKNV